MRARTMSVATGYVSTNIVRALIPAGEIKRETLIQPKT
jgi:hypothetical protein